MTVEERELAALLRTAVAEERQACVKIMCDWCGWRSEPSGSLAHVEPAHREGEIWIHDLVYTTGAIGHVECNAGLLWARP